MCFTKLYITSSMLYLGLFQTYLQGRGHAPCICCTAFGSFRELLEANRNNLMMGYSQAPSIGSAFSHTHWFWNKSSLRLSTFQSKDIWPIIVSPGGESVSKGIFKKLWLWYGDWPVVNKLHIGLTWRGRMTYPGARSPASQPSQFDVDDTWWKPQVAVDPSSLETVLQLNVTKI